MSQLKTYLYISRTKVDMWYDQIASSADASGAEYGVDLKFLKWIGKREAKEPGLITKVQRIEETVRRTDKVGQFPNFLEFVAGAVEMRWGTVRGMACFVTQTSHLQMMLVGSEEHLIGGPPVSPALMRATSFDITRILTQLSREYAGDHVLSGPPENQSSAGRLYPVSIAIENFDAPIQKLDFLAKTLLHGEVGEKYVLVASPLYVALAE